MKLVMQCYPVRSKNHEARYTMHSSSCYSLTPANPPLHSVVEHLQVLPGDQTAYPHKNGNTVVLDILYFHTANGKTKDSEHNSKRSSNSFPHAQLYHTFKLMYIWFSNLLFTQHERILSTFSIYF
jgi:hypothetical protein